MTSTGTLDAPDVPTTAGRRGRGAPEVPSGHRPALDGLRAVAVYLVILFHVGSSRFAGGFIGVDVFFVLSGYLVTQVLLRDLDRHGSIRFGRFYARRARRLLPAAALALLGTAVVYAAIASPAELTAAREDIRASFLYVANWHFIDRSTGYFADDSSASPVLHTWSLAVEEQFYVLWPLVLAALAWGTARLGRWRWTSARVAVALAATASAGWAVHLRVAEPDRAYFGTDTRAYQLLAGALLALTPALAVWAARHRWLPRVVAPAGLLAVLVLATDRLVLGPIFRGIAVTVAVGGLIVALEAARSGLVARALGTGPLVHLGQISYGTYLWHWPVIIVLERQADLSPRLLAGVVAVIATGIASVSYQLVEQPIRTSRVLDEHRWKVVVAGLAVSILAATVVLPRLTTEPDRVAVAATRDITDFTPVPASFDHDEIFYEKFGETVDCVDRAPEDCTVVRGDGPHILLMGDSNAQMWIPTFTAMAEAEDLTLSLSVAPGCPWQRGFEHLSEAIKQACRRVKTDAYERVIPALDPDLIVLVNVDVTLPRGAPAPMADTPHNNNLRATTRNSLQELGAGGRPLVIIEPIPHPTGKKFSPLECLDGAEVVESCRFTAVAEPTWLEEYQRQLADESDTIAVADFDRLVCPFAPICDPIIGDTVVFWNGEHLTRRYSRSLTPDVTAFFREQELIP